MKNIKMLIALTIVGVAIRTVCGVDTSTVRMISGPSYWFSFSPEPTGPRPLVLPSNGEFALFGHVLGKTYPLEEKASRAIRGDVVEKFTPTYQISEVFHGIHAISCELTPVTQRLYSLRLERGGFAGREELLKEGQAVLEDLSNQLGCKLAPFKYVDLDNVDRILPDPFLPDASLWTASQRVLAVSHTRMGTVALIVKLKVERHGWRNLTILATDSKLAVEGRREFELEVRRRKNPRAVEKDEEKFPQIEVEFPE